MLQDQEGAQLTMASDDETSLVRSNSLEQRLAPSASEKSLSEREFIDLIAFADSLRQFDERKGDRAVLDAVEGTYVREGNFPVTVAYEVAESLGISADYMERALALRYPTAEQQFADIKAHDAVPGSDTIVSTYIRLLTESLRKASPLDKISVKDEISDLSAYIDFRKVSTRKRQKSFLFWQWNSVRNEIADLANFEFKYGWSHLPQNKFTLSIKVKCPTFLRACGDTLVDLKKHFAPQLYSYEVSYHYVVE